MATTSPNVTPRTGWLELPQDVKLLLHRHASFVNFRLVYKHGRRYDEIIERHAQSVWREFSRRMNRLDTRSDVSSGFNFNVMVDFPSFEVAVYSSSSLDICVGASTHHVDKERHRNASHLHVDRPLGILVGPGKLVTLTARVFGQKDFTEDGCNDAYIGDTSSIRHHGPSNFFVQSNSCLIPDRMLPSIYSTKSMPSIMGFWIRFHAADYCYLGSVHALTTVDVGSNSPNVLLSVYLHRGSVSSASHLRMAPGSVNVAFSSLPNTVTTEPKLTDCHYLQPLNTTAFLLPVKQYINQAANLRTALYEFQSATDDAGKSYCLRCDFDTLTYRLGQVLIYNVPVVDSPMLDQLLLEKVLF